MPVHGFEGLLPFTQTTKDLRNTCEYVAKKYGDKIYSNNLTITIFSKFRNKLKIFDTFTIENS